LKKNIDMRYPALILTLSCLIGCSVKEQKAGSDEQSSNANSFSPEMFEGAWQAQEESDSGSVLQHVITITDGFFSEVVYIAEPPRFLYTIGGRWQANASTISWDIEYHSQDSASVGSSTSFEYNVKNEQIEAAGLIWSKVDDGTPGDLNGAWLITGRERNGELRRRTPGERKTMKILSGTRFQWIAYHTGTGAFFGTGGGSYTTIDGNYTENIEFFSRDNSRVGASLQFDYQLDAGEWFHSGLSSKGERLMEIWSPRAMVEN
jgi:hypothetical protein